MLPFSFRLLRRGREVLRKFSKNNFLKNNNNCSQSFDISINIMPPKRKAATVKPVSVEESDLAAGGDQLEAPATKTRKGKEVTKELEPPAPKTRKGKEEGTKEKKGTKKQVPAKGKEKEIEKEIPEKKKID
ncbi:hypothetical protein NQ314_015930 [Rhamnusium bicolor]|uniref:Uncharacterized protein n=1 Tax=Rhamnusium bicolor TaxID=1586634 RepID=A0AAV8WY58_9CUCU|nr:hypothetical protein NQ314_015930 [Rhamnusium bicolor]